MKTRSDTCDWPKSMVEGQEPPTVWQERLGHASGALSDIYGLATDCVPKGASPEIQDIFKTIVSRILSSAHKVQTPPSWYRFPWEEEQWRKYLSGEMKACASDLPCIEIASRLQDADPNEKIEE